MFQSSYHSKEKTLKNLLFFNYCFSFMHLYYIQIKIKDQHHVKKVH